MIRALIIGSFFLLALNACQDNVLSSAEWEMEDQLWVAGDQKTFTLEAVDTSTVYAMMITLNHDASFPNQNLYIKTQTVFPSGKEVESVTSVELLNEDGTWAGDCSGQACQITLPLQQRFTFPEIGLYTWSVEQYMRTDTLSGLNSFKVECREVESISK